MEVKNEFNQDESQIRLYSVTEFKSHWLGNVIGIWLIILYDSYTMVIQSVPIVFCIVELSNSILQLRSQTSDVSVALKADLFPIRSFDQSDLL